MSILEVTLLVLWVAPILLIVSWFVRDIRYEMKMEAERGYEGLYGFPGKFSSDNLLLSGYISPSISDAQFYSELYKTIASESGASKFIYYKSVGQEDRTVLYMN